MTPMDQHLLTLWRRAAFKGDLMVRLPLEHAARLVDLVNQYEPPLPPCGQGDIRRRAFAQAERSGATQYMPERA